MSGQYAIVTYDLSRTFITSILTDYYSSGVEHGGVFFYELWKRLTARKRVVHALYRLNIRVRKGSFTCLLGPNGSGKTTLLRILATFLLPTSGRAEVMGYDVVAERREVLEVINYIPSLLAGSVWANLRLTVRRNLEIMAKLVGVGEDRVETALKITVPLPALGKKIKVSVIELWHVNAGYNDPTAIIVRDLEGEHYYRVWSHSYYFDEGYYVDVLEEIKPSPMVLSTSLEEVTVETLEKGVTRTEYSFREGRIYLDVTEIISIRFTILTNATLEEAGISGNKLSVVVSSPGRAFVKITLPDVLFNRFGLSEKDVRVWVNGAEVEGGAVKRDAMGNVIDLIVEGRSNVTAKFGRTLEISIVDKEGKSQFAIVYLRHRGRLLNTTYAEGHARFIFVPLEDVEVEICRLDVTHVVRELGTTEEKVEITLPTTKEEYLEENEKLGTMYSEVKSKYEELVKEHSELEEEYTRARKTYVEALSELEDLRNKYGKLSKELEDLRKKLKSLSEELERALEEVSAKIEPLHAAIYAVAAAAAGIVLGFIIGRKTTKH